MTSNKKPSISFFLLLAIILDFNYLQGQSIPSYVPTNGLIGWWGFNGNAQDGSGNGNHGTVNGATLTSDRFGVQNAAFSFNGVNNWIQVQDNSSLRPSNITLAAWVFLPTNTNNYSLITKSSLQTAQGEQYALLLNAGSINQNQFAVKSNSGCSPGNGWRDLMVQTVNSVNQWRFIVATYDGISLRYYENAVLSSNQTSFSGGIDNCPGGTLNFGRYWDGQVAWFNGKIDDIGIWNRALSQQEITLLYQNCQGFLTTQPSNQATSANSIAQFSVVYSEPNSTYRWQSNSGFGFQDLHNAGQYSGVTISTLTVSNTSLQNNNQLFRCIVTTPNCGSDTSDVVTLTVSSSGQGPALPRKFNYQAVVRDSMGTLITNRNVSLRVTLLRGSAPHSPELFKETHQANTNATGLLTVKIGNGQSILGSVDSIDWSQGMVYLRTEMDPTGGNTFSVVNTAELLSVPYALYSLNSGGGPPGPAGPQGPSGPSGLQGVQGAPGNDGVGILSITNTGNNMVITLSNGNTYSVPIPNSSSQQLNHVKTLIYTTDGF